MANNEDTDFFTETFEKRPPSAKWGKVMEGDRCVKDAVESGEVLSVNTEQKRTWVDGKPTDYVFWDDGTKRMQGVVIIQTSQAGVLGAEDDGRRTLYVEGAMRKAIGDAIKEAGATKLQVGGKLAVKNTGMAKNSGGYLAYTWAAKYVPPAPPSDEFFGGSEPAPSEADKVAAKVAESRSTLQKIQQSDHQAGLRKGFEDEPPF